MHKVLKPLCLPSQLTWDTSSQIRGRPCCLHFAIACHGRNLCMIVPITAAKQRGTMQAITRKPVPKLQNGGQDSFVRRIDLREQTWSSRMRNEPSRHVYFFYKRMTRNLKHYPKITFLSCSKMLRSHHRGDPHLLRASCPFLPEVCSGVPQENNVHPVRQPLIL